MTHVLVVDDEQDIVAIVRDYLADAGYRVSTARSGEEALRLLRSIVPDLVVLDLGLPGIDGLDVTRRVRSTSAVPIIMLTARSDEADRVIGLELGADDYVVKPFSARELVARIRAVLRRTSAAATPAPNGPLQIGAVELDASARTVTLDGQPLELTRKEFDLLALLMGQAGTVVSRERLIDEVWDVNWFGSTKTLDVHVSGVRTKLGDDSSDPRDLHTVRGVGFRFASSVESDAP